MASFNRTSSPVLTMSSASAAHQDPFGMSAFSHQSSHFGSLDSFGAAPAWSQPAAPAAAAPAPSVAAGRKRSRDEAAINLDVEEAKLETIEPIKEVEDEWIFGPGMMLIKSPTSYVADAGSQSGTWVEEKSAADEARRAEEARALNQQERPSLRSNKSQRLDMNVVSLPGTADTGANRSSPVRDSPNAAVVSSGIQSDLSSQPVIDNFTLHLGIGWSRISEDEDIQAAARGWARYIENHFPVNNVRIQLKSKGLQSYLVEASEGYFLFAEDLRQGQLVSTDLTRAFQNLRSSPPVFDGIETLSAAESPRPAEVSTPQYEAPIPSADTDMDMS